MRSPSSTVCDETESWFQAVPSELFFASALRKHNQRHHVPILDSGGEGLATTPSTAEHVREGSSHLSIYVKTQTSAQPRESESVESSPSRMHVDGDILSRLVARGAGYLHRMLVSGDLYDLSSHDTGTTQATMERFSVLAEDALGRSTNQVEAVMKWLRNTLHMQL